jgi:DNA-directed RNA polymerase subunit RPC12/RpoP
MAKTADAGNRAELELVRLVPCPNCAKRLIQLPKNYPLYDVQCTGCSFRAQVKGKSAKPQDRIFGAGWDVLRKVLKSGFLIPPLFVSFSWREGSLRRQEIRFYPFVPKSNIAPYRLSPSARRANYRMFLYTGLSKLPQFVVFSRGREDR